MSGFKIPLDLSNCNFYNNNRRIDDERNLKESIDDFVKLLVNSPNGSFKPDSRFGFSLKNLRFENANEEGKIRGKKIGGESENFDNFAKDLEKSLKQFESRLQNPKVKITYDRKQTKGTILITDLSKKYKQEIKFHIWTTDEDNTRRIL